MEKLILTETEIVNRIKAFLIAKENGNWLEDNVKTTLGHVHGADIVMRGGKKLSEYFIIECKGKSYAKSSKSINKEGWLNALGQIITRMNTNRVIKNGKNKGEINRAYKYGLGLYWESAQVALYRIPKTIAKTLNLYIFSCYDNGFIKQISPSKFGKHYTKDFFMK